MSLLNIPNDKMYIVAAVVIIAIGLIIYGGSVYVKSCVRTELGEIKKQNKKKKKMRQEEFEGHVQRQQFQELQNQQLQQLQQMPPQMQQQIPQQMHHDAELPEIDADSYMDPLSE